MTTQRTPSKALGVEISRLMGIAKRIKAVQNGHFEEPYGSTAPLTRTPGPSGWVRVPKEKYEELVMQRDEALRRVDEAKRAKLANFSLEEIEAELHYREKRAEAQRANPRNEKPLPRDVDKGKRSW